jgi:hypothetical protein
VKVGRLERGIDNERINHEEELQKAGISFERTTRIGRRET